MHNKYNTLKYNNCFQGSEKQRKPNRTTRCSGRVSPLFYKQVFVSACLLQALTGFSLALFIFPASTSAMTPRSSVPPVTKAPFTSSHSKTLNSTAAPRKTEPWPPVASLLPTNCLFIRECFFLCLPQTGSCWEGGPCDWSVRGQPVVIGQLHCARWVRLHLCFWEEHVQERQLCHRWGNMSKITQNVFVFVLLE